MKIFFLSCYFCYLRRSRIIIQGGYPERDIHSSSSSRTILSLSNIGFRNKFSHIVDKEMWSRSLVQVEMLQIGGF